MASEVMALILAVLDVSFNSGHYTIIIKRQVLYINICNFLPYYLHACICTQNSKI